MDIKDPQKQVTTVTNVGSEKILDQKNTHTCTVMVTLKVGENIKNRIVEYMTNITKTTITNATALNTQKLSELSGDMLYHTANPVTQCKNILSDIKSEYEKSMASFKKKVMEESIKFDKSAPCKCFFKVTSNKKTTIKSVDATYIDEIRLGTNKMKILFPGGKKFEVSITDLCIGGEGILPTENQRSEQNVTSVGGSLPKSANMISDSFQDGGTVLNYNRVGGSYYNLSDDKEDYTHCE